MRNLILILGDQLDRESAVFDDFDPEQDAVWMAEVAAEASHVWSHKARIAVFIAAMRHFRRELERRAYTVHYRMLDDPENREDFAGALESSLSSLEPQRIVMCPAGEFRVQRAIEDVAKREGVPVDVVEDRHFYCSPTEFAAHAEGRKQLRMEFFYREMRRRTGVLMDGDDPVGGKWNLDAENRRAFGKSGPPDRPAPRSFPPDDITADVIETVEEHFAEHPGSLRHFDWPVTGEHAEMALADFIEHRLPQFGDFQDAMWFGEPWLFHSRLSVAMNLKLLNPRRAVAAAVAAYEDGHAPLNAVEGFVRQILGWREYVRGIYWLYMPGYVERNTLGADLALPAFYWTGETPMRCLAETIGQTLEYGYAHHIQRLMVTGLFGLLLGVNPKAMHEWYLAVYVDAIEWVELPNTLGMSQYADGGVMASKPYVATGNYTRRMSNYCTSCPYDPKQAIGDEACPFTTLYWDFLIRHEAALRGNPRMSLQLRNLARKAAGERERITARADALRDALGGDTG